MELTDEELNVVHDVVYGEVMYGDDEIVYGDGDDARNLRSALIALTVEAKKRKMWWAQ